MGYTLENSLVYDSFHEHKELIVAYFREELRKKLWALQDGPT